MTVPELKSTVYLLPEVAELICKVSELISNYTLPRGESFNA